MSTGDGFYHHHRAWADDLRLPFAAIGGYIAQLRDGHEPRPAQASSCSPSATGSPTEYARAPRDRRGAHAVRRRCSASAATCSRTRRAHKFFIEHWGTSLFFNKMREIGAVLAEQGFFAEADDIFYLNIHEVHEALSDVGLAWSGGSARARHRLLAAAGRAAQGDPRAARRVDAAARARRRAGGDQRPDRAAALGRHRRAAARLGERATARATCSGYAASPGVVEGVARVVRDVERDRRRCSRARCSSAR